MKKRPALGSSGRAEARAHAAPARAVRAGELSKQIFGDPREAEEILDVFI